MLLLWNEIGLALLIKIFISFKILIWLFLISVKYAFIYCLIIPAIPTAIIVILSVFLIDYWKTLTAQGKEPLKDWTVGTSIIYIAVTIFLLLVAIWIYFQCGLADCIRRMRVKKHRVAPEATQEHVRMNNLLQGEDSIVWFEIERNIFVVPFNRL